MKVTHNIIANYLGRAWVVLINLVFVPVYLDFIGVEAYGLVGVYMSLIVIISMLDLGLSTTLNRFLAQSETEGLAGRDIRDMVRSFELVYWLVGLVITVVIFLIAPWIADNWLNQENIARDTVISALRLMSLIIFFQWPGILYGAGLMGAERMVLLNVIRSTVATFQAVGAVLVLWLVSPTIQAYFSWQILAFVLQVVLLSRCLARSLPEIPEYRARFKWDWLMKSWRFSAGTMAITILATVLTQLDKVVLSKTISLIDFGYYSLAFVASNALLNIASPVYSAVFPRLSKLCSGDNAKGIARLYHKSSALMYVLLIPVGVNCSLYSESILELWLQDTNVALNVAPLLSVMIIGTTVNALMLMPLALQLAYGWTKLSLYKNIAAVIIFVPMLFYLVTLYGAMGGAISWVVLNVGYLLVEPVLMHRRVLKDEILKWYMIDLGVPVVVVIVVSAIIWLLNMEILHGLVGAFMSVFFSWIVLALLVRFSDKYKAHIMA